MGIILLKFEGYQYGYAYQDESPLSNRSNGIPLILNQGFSEKDEKQT